MKNSIILLAVALTIFMTSCSDDSSLGIANEAVDQTATTMEIDPESGENREVVQFNLEDIMSDSKNQVLDLTDIIEADALTAEKGVEGKSILVNIYNSNRFVSHGGWFTVVYRTSHLRNCYYQYRVTIIPSYGDPDVSIWGYDHSRYNSWRKVRGATYYPGYGREETYFKKCDFGYYEEKAVIGVYADQRLNTSFTIRVDRIS